MKTLWLPDVYSHQVVTSSCVQAHRSVARGLWEHNKAFQSYMLLPAPCKYFQYAFPSDTEWMKFLPFVSRIDILGFDVEGDRFTVPDLQAVPEDIDVLVTSRLFMNAFIEQWCNDKNILSVVWHVDFWRRQCVFKSTWTLLVR